MAEQGREAVEVIDFWSRRRIDASEWFGRVVTARTVMSDTSKEIIRDANDRFRRGDVSIPGERYITSGLASLIKEAGKAPLDVLQLVADFDIFTEDNDPYGTHEFGSFEFEGQTCFWKIDLYDNDLTYGSPEPTDLSQTKRVLTIMLASEY